MTALVIVAATAVLAASLLLVWRFGWRRLRTVGAWYIVTPLGDMGPFPSYEAADSYPGSFRGWVDAPLFRSGYEVEYRAATWGQR